MLIQMSVNVDALDDERECAQVGSVTTREGFTMVYNKTKHTHRVLHKYTPTHNRLSRHAVPNSTTDSDGYSDDYMNYKTALSF